MRHKILILLLAVVTLFTACSFPIDFAVVNRSDSPIEVRFKVFGFSGEPLERFELLAKMMVSQLGDGEWQDLSASEYRVDRENRMVTAQVMPGEALRVARVPDSDMQDGEPMHFSIEEIAITGAHGEIRLQGEQARKAFVAETKKVHTLTYK
jgi:hypothetical protein